MFVFLSFPLDPLEPTYEFVDTFGVEEERRGVAVVLRDKHHGSAPVRKGGLVLDQDEAGAGVNLVVAHHDLDTVPPFGPGVDLAKQVVPGPSPLRPRGLGALHDEFVAERDPEPVDLHVEL